MVIPHLITIESIPLPTPPLLNIIKLTHLKSHRCLHMKLPISPTDHRNPFIDHLNPPRFHQNWSTGLYISSLLHHDPHRHRTHRSPSKSKCRPRSWDERKTQMSNRPISLSYSSLAPSRGVSEPNPNLQLLRMLIPGGKEAWLTPVSCSQMSGTSHQLHLISDFFRQTSFVPFSSQRAPPVPRIPSWAISQPRPAASRSSRKKAPQLRSPSEMPDNANEGMWGTDHDPRRISPTSPGLAHPGLPRGAARPHVFAYKPRKSFMAKAMHRSPEASPPPELSPQSPEPPHAGTFGMPRALAGFTSFKRIRDSVDKFQLPLGAGRFGRMQR
jgi:hypothetical protein